MREAFAGFWRQTAGLLLLALGLRLFFALACPHMDNDSLVYEAFARNLLQSGVYSHLEPQDHQTLRPTMIRLPGYPLMLAAIFKTAGIGNETAVRVVQALLDTWTCLLIALIVFEMSLGGGKRRKRLAQWALFLSAVCPFSANYSATILTEVPTTLLWTAATLYGLRALRHPARGGNWFYCGLLTGGATLFRPESGTLLGILFVVLLLKQSMQRAWQPILMGGSLMAAGLTLALLPWTVRNAVTLRTFQPLAPTQAQDLGERVPTGYLDWCRTWIWRYGDVESYWFPLEAEDLPTDPLPAAAGDNEAQRQQALALMRRHNNDGDNLDPASDEEFGSIARERRRAHPFRYYVALPLLRSFAMWFTPRVQALDLEGKLLPVSQAFENDPMDFSVTLLLFLVNIAYLILAVIGAAKILRRRHASGSAEPWAGFALLAIIAIRTGIFAFFEFPEPRYVLEAYPSVIALGAFVFCGTRDSLTGMS